LLEGRQFAFDHVGRPLGAARRRKLRTHCSAALPDLAIAAQSPDLLRDTVGPAQGGELLAKTMMSDPRKVARLVEAYWSNQQRHTAGQGVEHGVAAPMRDAQGRMGSTAR
jgi:hypothetical protein